MLSGGLDPGAESRIYCAEKRNMISILCMIGAHVDVLYRLRSPARPGLSVPSTREIGVGGCALNVAAGLSVLGINVSHGGIRGWDSDGEAVAAILRERQVADVGATLPDVTTAHYAALVEPSGSLALATAAMDAYDRSDTLLDHPPLRQAAATADVMVLDVNAPPHTIRRLADLRGKDTHLVLLATSTDKVRHLEPVLSDAAILFANAGEWQAIADVQADVAHAVVSDGERGATLHANGEPTDHFAAHEVEVADVIGAGDALCAGTLRAWSSGVPLSLAIEDGIAAAARCVSHPGALGWLAAPNLPMRYYP